MPYQSADTTPQRTRVVLLEIRAKLLRQLAEVDEFLREVESAIAYPPPPGRSRPAKGPR